MKIDVKNRLMVIEEEKRRIILKLKIYQFTNTLKALDKLEYSLNISAEFKQKV